MDAADRDLGTDGRRLRWAEHRAGRRAALVAAGAAAIDRFGPQANAEQIAATAGVSRTVLYRYFRDREDLRRAIADQIVTEVVATVSPHLAIGPASTPRQVITAAVSVMFGWFDEHPNQYAFLRTRRSGAGLEAVENTLAGRISELLTLVMALFGADAAQAEPGAFGIVGLVESTASWWLARRTLTRDQVIAVVSDSIWHLVDGVARDNGISVGYDDPLPIAELLGGTG